MWIYIVFILHSILISSTLSTTSNLKKEDNLVAKTCKRTNNFKLCYSYLEFSNAADVKGLARIILEYAQRHANDTVVVVSIYNGEEVPSKYPMENKCRGDIHRFIYELLPDAIHSLDSNDYGGAKKSVRNAADIAITCKDQIRTPGHGSLRTHARRSFKLVHSLCLVAFDIISILG